MLPVLALAGRDIYRRRKKRPAGTFCPVCGYDLLCVAKKGYDGPTGLGTPDGTGAF